MKNVYIINEGGYEGWIFSQVAFETKEKAIEWCEIEAKKQKCKRKEGTNIWYSPYHFHFFEIVEHELGKEKKTQKTPTDFDDVFIDEQLEK